MTTTTTIILLVFAAVLIAGAMAAVSRRESQRNRAIRALAARRKFKHITGNGAERTMTSISSMQHREYAFSNMHSGVVSGLGITFFDMTCALNSGEISAHGGLLHTEVTTRVKVHLKGHNLPHFILMPQRVMSAMVCQLPKTTPVTFPEDRAFNRHNALLSDETNRTHHLFDSPDLRALFADNETICIEGKRDSITVFKYNMLLSASQLEALIERTVKVAGSLNLPPLPTVQPYSRKATGEPVPANATLSPA